MSDRSYTSQTRTIDVEGVVLGLAAQEATGCLAIANGPGLEGLVWFRDGQVYAVSVPGRRPLLGVRLVTGGVITADQLNEALLLQRSQMSSSRLGEVLVHLGWVNRRVVEAFVLEQQRDMLAELLNWPVTSHHFRNGAVTRTDLSPFVEVSDLILQARERQAHWVDIVDEIGGFDIVPRLTGELPHAELAPIEAIVLGLIDGVRMLTDIADECGFTLYETSDVIRGLAASGLVYTGSAAVMRPREVAAPEIAADVEVIDDRPLAAVLTLHPAHETGHEVVAVVEPVAAVASVTEEIYALAPEPVAPTPPAPPAPQSMPEPSLMPAPSAGPLAAPASPLAGEPNDTAALLRELTSLGLNDAAR